MIKNKQVLIDAVNSDFLKNRSSINKGFASADFEGWVEYIVRDIKSNNILDICCGTGNQLVLYAKNKEFKSLSGVDMSTESLSLAQDRLTKVDNNIDPLLVNVEMDDIFSTKEFNNRKFDLISCFYGLYYSNDVEKLLDDLIEHLEDNGSILLVGPYGKNNSSFFSLLSKYFKLPELVYKSSCTFMEDDVLPFLSKKLSIETKFFINQIKYPNVDSVMNYWKSTTFYAREYEKNIRSDLEKHFLMHDNYIIEKHVMAIIATTYNK
jgi:ubiquinone/menaquinone biosynthesis C-methylase UbiE